MNSSFCVRQIRRASQALLDRLTTIPKETLTWRASETNPLKQTSEHEGFFYVLPEPNELLRIYGLPRPFDLQLTDYYAKFGFTPLMVRKPFLDAKGYLERLDSSPQSVPNVRILFYGDKGHGKTHTLAHLIHHEILAKKRLVLHIRDVKTFTRNPLNFQPSTSRTNRIDMPTNAMQTLNQFRIMNDELLSKCKDDLVCSQDYKWSVREETKRGEPLENVILHGIERENHASDCFAVLIKELMLACDQGKVSLVSFLDNVRFLFLREAGVLRHPDLKQVLVDEITVARALKKLIRGTHRNAVLMATCDNKLVKTQDQTPREVLGLEGWNAFDPCLPVHVPRYSRLEFESCLNMFQDCGWLCRPESCTQEVRDEVRFVSGLNPGQVTYLCREL